MDIARWLMASGNGFLVFGTKRQRNSEIAHLTGRGAAICLLQQPVGASWFCFLYVEHLRLAHIFVRVVNCNFGVSGYRMLSLGGD